MTGLSLNPEPSVCLDNSSQDGSSWVLGREDGTGWNGQILNRHLRQVIGEAVQEVVRQNSIVRAGANPLCPKKEWLRGVGRHLVASSRCEGAR